MTSAQFAQPALGTEGNEQFGAFRNPGYADTDLGVRKGFSVSDYADVQLRVDAFNVFNRPNLGAVVADLSNASFGRSTSQINSRYLQLGVAITF